MLELKQLCAQQTFILEVCFRKLFDECSPLQLNDFVSDFYEGYKY